MLQEVEPAFWGKMFKRSQAKAANEGVVAGGELMPLFIRVRVDEGHKENSLLIAGKPGLVLGCRLRVFHRRVDGIYIEKKQRKVAFSRIMVAELKMKNFRIRESGDSLSDILTVANVHMHSRTAKKQLHKSTEASKRFWDEVATLLVKYGARLLVGDFNMSFLCVIVELRARGFQINMAAWYPFDMIVQKEMMVDSCGVFVIGPWTGVRLIYDCALFNIVAPHRTANNSMVMEQIKDTDDNVINTAPYKAHKYTIEKPDKVKGYPLTSYLPKDTKKPQCVQWNFAHVADQSEESAVAEQKTTMKKEPQRFPAANFSLGASSWELPQMPECNQKLCFKQNSIQTRIISREEHTCPSWFYL